MESSALAVYLAPLGHIYLVNTFLNKIKENSNLKNEIILYKNSLLNCVIGANVNGGRNNFDIITVDKEDIKKFSFTVDFHGNESYCNVIVYANDTLIDTLGQNGTFEYNTNCSKISIKVNWGSGLKLGSINIKNIIIN